MRAYQLLVMSLALTSCTKQVITDPDQKIVMLGDSQTGKMNLYSSWNTELGTTNTVNLGFNGFFTTHLVNGAIGFTPLADAVAENASLVYITAGVNDMLNFSPEATAVANIKTMCIDLTASGATVVVSAIPPLTAARNLTWGAGAATYNQRIQDLNDALVVMCAEEGYEFMDPRVYTCERNDAGVWEMAEEFTDDGLHYNLAGYKQWCIPITYNINQH